MKQVEIRNDVNLRFKHINKACKKVLKHFDAESIHDFRVEIKKPGMNWEKSTSSAYRI